MLSKPRLSGIVDAGARPHLRFASSRRRLELQEALPHALVHLHDRRHVACERRYRGAKQMTRE